MIRGVAPILVSPLREDEHPLWKDFLANSPTASLFHDLDFLAYHPADRFSFEHLVLRQDGNILALLPGGTAQREEGTVFSSPLGASFGGPAVNPRMRTAQCLAMVQALQEYSQTQGWAGMDMTLPPAAFFRTPSDVLPFSLFSRGFRMANRWLCAMMNLELAPAPRFETFFRKRQATHVRAAARKGMTLAECGPEGLSHFLEVFEDTYVRHGVSATHTHQEIAWLLGRFPDRIRLYLAMLEGRCAAGVLVFMLTPAVAYTFYICTSTALAEEKGTPFLYAALADLLAERGVRWLDLGPTCWDGNFNAGVTFFKESLGCVTHCRDRWSWRRSWNEAPALAGFNFIAKESS